MAKVRPFKAIRPAREYADKVAALPFDVMSSDEARELVKDNEFSFLHVDKAEIDLDRNIDLYDTRVYEKARENLYSMLDKKITFQDEKAMFYIYRLVMNGRAQTGLVVCASIDEYLAGKIKKHEHTRADKEQDRINHVNYCNANTGPIFLAYRAKNEIDSLIKAWSANHKPEYDFVSEDEISHTIWVIDDDLIIENLARQFNEVEALYIADGHHRTASAVRVGLMRRENMVYNEDSEINYFLAVVFPDNELQIMDYNRLIQDLNGLDAAGFLEAVRGKFIVEEINCNVYKPEKLHTFGMYLEKKWYKLTARPEIIANDVVSSLDVSILQNELLAPVLGIGDPRTDKRIDFVGGIRGLEELVRIVDSGEMKVAIAMYPTSMGELMAIADSGEVMPPKSTWFEPKLRSGLFVHALD